MRLADLVSAYVYAQVHGTLMPLDTAVALFREARPFGRADGRCRSSGAMFVRQRPRASAPRAAARGAPWPVGGRLGRRALPVILTILNAATPGSTSPVLPRVLAQLLGGAGTSRGGYTIASYRLWLVRTLGLLFRLRT